MTKLDEIRARWEKATEGPWDCSLDPSQSDRYPGCSVGFSDGRWFVVDCDGPIQNWNNGRFIAHSWEDIRWLVGEVKRLQGLLSKPDSVEKASERELIRTEMLEQALGEVERLRKFTQWVEHSLTPRNVPSCKQMARRALEEE